MAENEQKSGRNNKIDVEMVNAARELWLRYKGKDHRRIEREMKEMGYRFRRQVLSPQPYTGGITVGWPEKFGWNAELGIADKSVHGFEVWLNETQDANGHMKWSWPYQRHLYKKLAEVTSGKCKRLMIFMPPRHGKSELVTIRYVAWRLLQEPGMNVILGSYNQRLADKFSRRINRLVEYEELAANGKLKIENGKLGTNGKLKTENGKCENEGNSPLSTVNIPLRRLKSVSEWETIGGGVVRSVGVGGGIAGFGAGLIVIDDPVRSRADAESENKRERADDWFKNDIYTRLEPDGAVILIQTRWHEDDLAGRLLKEMDDGGEKWEVVSLPAIAEERDEGKRMKDKDSGNEEDLSEAEGNNLSFIPDPLYLDELGRRPGEALCEERYGLKALERIRRKLGTYAFTALYQQRPQPLEGGQFKRAWFKRIVDYVPVGLQWKRGYDLATSTKTTADYTASLRVAMDKDGTIYIDGGFRKRIEYPEQRRFIIERMKTEPNTEHGIEAAIHGRAVVQDLRRDRELRRYALREVRVEADKLTRALAWLNLAEAGKVVLVRGPWITEFVDEIAAFPKGKHDDQIDAVSVAVNMLTRSHGRRAVGF